MGATHWLQVTCVALRIPDLKQGNSRVTDFFVAILMQEQAEPQRDNILHMERCV